MSKKKDDMNIMSFDNGLYRGEIFRGKPDGYGIFNMKTGI